VNKFRQSLHLHAKNKPAMLKDYLSEFFRTLEPNRVLWTVGDDQQLTSLLDVDDKKLVVILEELAKFQGVHRMDKLADYWLKFLEKSKYYVKISQYGQDLLKSTLSWFMFDPVTLKRFLEHKQLMTIAEPQVFAEIFKKSCARLFEQANDPSSLAFITHPVVLEKLDESSFFTGLMVLFPSSKMRSVQWQRNFIQLAPTLQQLTEKLDEDGFLSLVAFFIGTQDIFEALPLHTRQSLLSVIWPRVKSNPTLLKHFLSRKEMGMSLKPQILSNLVDEIFETGDQQDLLQVLLADGEVIDQIPRETWLKRLSAVANHPDYPNGKYLLQSMLLSSGFVHIISPLEYLTLFLDIYEKSPYLWEVLWSDEHKAVLRELAESSIPDGIKVLVYEMSFRHYAPKSYNPNWRSGIRFPFSQLEWRRYATAFLQQIQHDLVPTLDTLNLGRVTDMVLNSYHNFHF
jgi:hypothetical protein